VEALRSESSDRSGSLGGGALFLEDDETGREPLPIAIGRKERRLQVRAYSTWASLLGERGFPSLAALDLARLPDLALHGVLLDFTAELGDPIVRHLGDALAQECGPGAIGRLSDVPDRSLLAQIVDQYRETLEQQAPVGFEAEFVNWRGATILYRGILLPFSSDDLRVDHVFGVINWKELADAAVTDELQLHIAHAFEPLRHLQLNPGASANGAQTDADAMDADLVARLRDIEPRSLADFARNDDEFTLVLAHKRANGEVSFLGAIPHDTQLLEQAARCLLD
jgi:hypothetical protein